MAENETEQTEETQDVQAEQTEEVQTEQTEEVQTEQTEQPKESIVDKIGSMISRAKDAVTGGGSNDEIDVPDEFTEVARALNWSDEQTVEFTKDYTNEQLVEMIPSLTGANTAKADETAETVEKTDKAAEEKVEDSQEDDKLAQALTDIADLKERLGARDEKSAAEEHAGFNKRASDLFDKVSEDFEVFGKTDDLPKFPDGRLIPTSPQMKARLEVYGRAQQLKEAGMPGDEALELSLNAYKGANLAVETKRNVIKGLKKNEERLGGRRASHEGAVDGGGKDLSGPDVIQEVARRAGHEIPD